MEKLCNPIEYDFTQALISARTKTRLTQKELAERIGLRQSGISRIENGLVSPTVNMLQRIAAGMGKRLCIEFR